MITFIYLPTSQPKGSFKVWADGWITNDKQVSFDEKNAKVFSQFDDSTKTEISEAYEKCFQGLNMSGVNMTVTVFVDFVEV